jgi:hypothetical protein
VKGVEILRVGSPLAPLTFLVACGCGNPNSSEPRGAAPLPAQREQGSGGSATALRQRQIAFLNEIRTADPSYRAIQKAVLNQNNELGLILSRNVEMDSIPGLMRSILTRMAREFPGEDVTIVAYAPSNPPLPIGSARYDAQSRQMSYSPSNPQQF